MKGSGRLLACSSLLHNKRTRRDLKNKVSETEGALGWNGMAALAGDLGFHREVPVQALVVR